MESGRRSVGLNVLQTTDLQRFLFGPQQVGRDRTLKSFTSRPCPRANSINAPNLHFLARLTQKQEAPRALFLSPLTCRSNLYGKRRWFCNEFSHKITARAKPNSCNITSNFASVAPASFNVHWPRAMHIGPALPIPWALNFERASRLSPAPEPHRNQHRPLDESIDILQWLHAGIPLVGSAERK